MMLLVIKLYHNIVQLRGNDLQRPRPAAQLHQGNKFHRMDVFIRRREAQGECHSFFRDTDHVSGICCKSHSYFRFLKTQQLKHEKEPIHPRRLHRPGGPDAGLRHRLLRLRREAVQCNSVALVSARSRTDGRSFPRLRLSLFLTAQAPS